MPAPRSSRSLRLSTGLGRVRRGRSTRVVRTVPSPRSSGRSTPEMSAEFDSHAVPLPNEAQTEELVSLRVSPAPAAAATLSTFTDSQQTPAARSNLDRSSSAPAVMPSAEYTVPSETVPVEMKASNKCLTDGAGSKCGAFTNKDRQASPDDWISHMNESSQTSFVSPASWLREMAPAIHIEPFDGDPL
ncbi:hypothetical protein TTRE_0000909801, partial [Trichuris trichiura]